jgi:NADPH:quinone reductase-like Zn-dependent oxidoreductase
LRLQSKDTKLKYLEVGGVGSIACQLAKNVFGAAKVITTVSTEKVGKVDKLLGNGVVDQSQFDIVPNL